MMIDLHLLGATTTVADVDRLVARALDRSLPAVRAVVVPPAFAGRAVEGLRGSGVGVTGVVGYPLGLAKSTIKAIEATSLAKEGVDAVEVTPLYANVIAGDVDALRRELLEIVRGCRAARATMRVYVRLDLDALGTIDVGAVTTAIAQGACDGIILEARDAARAGAVMKEIPLDAALERKIVGVSVDGMSIDDAGVVRGVPFATSV